MRKVLLLLAIICWAMSGLNALVYLKGDPSHLHLNLPVAIFAFVAGCVCLISSRNEDL